MQTHKLRARRDWLALASALCAWFSAAIAAPEDARPPLVIVGKTVNYRQAADGGLTRLNYHFFAEISLPPELQGAAAQLVDPHGRVIPFQHRGDKLSIPADHDFPTLADLNASIPDGVYGVQFDAPAPRAFKGSIAIHTTNEVLADPVRITLLQDGHPVTPGAVEVDKPLTIAWSSFRKGRSDPVITDDVIFAHVGDCRGRVLARTRDAYRALSYTIAANILEAGATYQVDVERAPLQKHRMEHAPVAATYPATTYLDFHTQGVSSDTCPPKPYRMDNGQSDRPAMVRSVTAQVTFLYYDDLTAPRKFYSETLGLTPYSEREGKDGVSFYHPTPGTTIGLVKAPRNGVTPASKRSVVLVSFVTDDVASWYKKLKDDPHIHITKDLYDHPRVPIRAFEAEDPGGYSIEFFQWRTKQN